MSETKQSITFKVYGRYFRNILRYLSNFASYCGYSPDFGIKVDDMLRIHYMSDDRIMLIIAETPVKPTINPPLYLSIDDVDELKKLFSIPNEEYQGYLTITVNIEEETDGNKASAEIKINQYTVNAVADEEYFHHEPDIKLNTKILVRRESLLKTLKNIASSVYKPNIIIFVASDSALTLKWKNHKHKLSEYDCRILSGEGLAAYSLKKIIKTLKYSVSDRITIEYDTKLPMKITMNSIRTWIAPYVGDE